MTTSPPTIRRKPCRPPRGRAWHGAGRVLGFLGRLVRGLLAAAVLAALLTGLPWALTQFVGSPLPDHLPSWAEIEGVLLDPMTTTFLLDVLACLTWLVWTLFTLDVARCAIEIARNAQIPDLSAAGPVRRIAAVLVSGVLISTLGQRVGLAPTPLPAIGPGSTDVVAAASAWSHPSEQVITEVRAVVYNTPHRSAPDVAVRRPVHAKSAVVFPYNPQAGVYDSLWRMAERTLGDGNRWPEIYELNKDKPQPDGGTFTSPSLVFPGEEMALPHDATVSATPPSPPALPPGPVTPPPTTATPLPSSQTTLTPSATQAPQATRVPPNSDAPGESGFSWGEELFVGLGLASAVSTALVVARRRNCRRYRPGSGDRSDLPVAPVVYQLRLAHLRTDQDGLDVADDRSLDDPAPVLPVGVRDSHEIALDVTAAHGLGLIGAGAAAAVRALLITILTTTSETADGPARVVVAAEDLVVLLGRRAAQAPLPVSVHVVADLDAALDVLESETLVRVGHHPSTGQTWGPMVLVARTPGRQSRRLQAVLDNGSSVGVTGLLLGQWASGVTAYVRSDGTISTTSPGLGEPLRDTSVFRLGDDHIADLLTLLRLADPDSRYESKNTTGGELPPVHLSRPHVVLDDLLAANGDAERPGDRDLEILGSASASETSSGFRLRPADSARTRTESIAAADFEHPAGAGGTDADGVASLVPLRISVLGPPQVWWCIAPTVSEAEAAEREVTSAFQPRLRELLVFLALHPDGVSREALIAALWATSPPEKTTNAMNTSLSRFRRALAAATNGALSDVVLVGEGRYRLDPGIVEVDYWSFAAAVAARRAATTDQQRVEAYRRIVDNYRGPLADGLSTDWIETAREAIRRDAIDAAAALARALVDHDPQQTLDLLEIARAFDPHNELIYRDIMRLQERLGQLDAIPRTLTLLTTRLAEIDDRPTQQAVDLAQRLRRRHDALNDPARADRGHSRAG